MPKKLYFVLWAICFCVAVGCLCGILYFRAVYSQADTFYKNLPSYPQDYNTVQTNQSLLQSQAKSEPERFDWTMAKQEIPDLVGWIEGAGLNYPVVQAKDNEFYLNHLPNQEKNAVGSIFLDFENRPDFSGDVSVIYGHNVKQGRMFGDLKQYSNQEFYEKNSDILLHIPSQDFVIEVFASVLVDAQTQSYPKMFEDEQQRNEFLQTVTQNSLIETGRFPKQEDKLVILSTCSSQSSDLRFALIGILKQKNSESSEK